MDQKGVVVLKNNSDITAYLGLRYVKVLCGIFQKTLLPLTSTCSLIQCSSEPLILMEVCAFFQVCRCQLEVWELHRFPLIHLPYLRLRQLTLRAQGKLIAGTEPRPSATQEYFYHTPSLLLRRNTQPLMSCKEHIYKCIVGNQNNEKICRNILLEEYEVQFLKLSSVKLLSIKYELFIMMSTFGEQYPSGNLEYLERETS